VGRAGPEVGQANSLRHSYRLHSSCLRGPFSGVALIVVLGLTYLIGAYKTTSIVGKRLGHYEIVSLLGVGGMGEVYRARDHQLHRDVAIKLILPTMLGDSASRTRLLREARAAAGLNHPNICTIHGVGDSEGEVYIAMELIEGQPLERVIPPDGLPIDEVLRYSLQITDAVAHAHFPRHHSS